jgi:hypothetical protein
MINRYLNNVEQTKDTVQVMTSEDRSRQLMENLGLINETECPSLEFVDVPKVNKYILGLLGSRYRYYYLTDNETPLSDLAVHTSSSVQSRDNEALAVHKLLYFRSKCHT